MNKSKELKEIQTEKYIGIKYQVNGRDYSGIDCYGLVRLVYKEELGIDLPSFIEEGINPERTQELILQYREGWEPTETISTGDVVIFKVMGVDSHIAIAISPTHFLHARQGYESAIESFSSPKWKNRLVGSYKYSPVKSAVLNGIPHPLRTERITTAVPAGTNVVQLEQWILKEYQIDTKLHPYVKVLVNGIPIPDDMKESTIIQDSDCVEYRVVPQGDGNSILRTLLTIAVVVAVMYATGGTASGGLGWGSSMGIAGTTATQIGLTVVGMSLVNAIAPIRLPSSNVGDPANPGSAEQQLMVNGGANRATPYASIPFVLGKVRMTPPLGANSYSLFNADGTESYLRMLLIWGYGPLFVDETTLKIGELPIANYKEVTQQTQTRITEPTAEQDAAFKGLYGSDITQVYSGVELTCDGAAGLTSSFTTRLAGTSVVPYGSSFTLPAGYVDGSLVAYQVFQTDHGNGPSSSFLSISITSGVATFSGYLWAGVDVTVRYNYDQVSAGVTPGPWLTYSSTDGAVSDFNIAVHFPQGCRKVASTGATAGQSYISPVNLEIEYKKASSATWISAGTKVVGNATVKDAFTKVFPVTYESNENVQVRIRRLTGTGNTAPVDENFQWLFTSTLLNVTFSRNAQPATDPYGCKIAKTALQIRASDQFNSQIEGVNAIVWTYGKSWNGTTWVDANINNPAALFRHVLEHPANPRRVTDISKLDLVQLQHWHEYCTTKGFTFNSIVGSTRSVLDILRDICAAGRASPAMVDGKWTVTIDEPRANVVQHFSPHNSWGFEGTKALPRIPDGLRVAFINEAKDYQNDETIVYSSTSSEATAALLESISVPGVTTLAQAQDHARWHMAQAKLRPEVYTLNTDIEYMVCNRGDRVKVMHDIPMWGLGSGRIKNKLSTTVLELTETVPITAALSYGIRIRSVSGASNERVVQKVFTPAFAQRTSGSVTVTSAGHALSIGDSVAVAMTGVSLNANPAIVTAITTDTFSYALAGANVGSTAVTGTITLNDGYYSKIKLTAAIIDADANYDDLFLYGEYQKESQDCVVLTIEPMSNKSARLTLVDYGVTPLANIYTDYLNYTNTLAYSSNISLPPTLLIQSFGTKVPTITGIISDERVMQKIAQGVFAYNMQVSYTNATDLPATVNSVEFQWDFVTAVDEYGLRSTQVGYNSGSVMLGGVDEGEAFKVRCRYVGNDGRTGLWSSWSLCTIAGKTTPPAAVVGFTASTDSTTGKLKFTWSANTEPDLKSYEVRTDALWGNGTNLVFLGDANTCTVTPSASGSTTTYYIKAVDYSQNYSTNASSVSFTANAPSDVTGVNYIFADTSLTAATITLSWTDVSPAFGLNSYEITYGAQVKTLSSNTITLPADWIGDRTYVIKTVDNAGHKSIGYSKVITKYIPNPATNFRAQVIDNTVMFYWDLPLVTSLPIDHVLIKKGSSSSTWETATIIGEKKGGFTTQNETQAGTYKYYLAVVDTDGNESTPVSIITAVSAPPDFVFLADYLSTFTGTKVSAATDVNNGGLILPINTTETFQQHFTTNAWSTPQDQINAGYPVYIQPGAGSAYYEETFDYGTLLTSSKVSLIYSGSIIAGSPVISTNISISTDNSIWVDYVGVQEIFATSFRYVKVRVSVTGSASSIYRLGTLQVKLDSKLQNDAGTVACLGTDALGTIFNFNKEFIDITSITVSPLGSTPIIPVYDFIDSNISATYSVSTNVCTVTAVGHGLITGQKVRLGFSTGLGISAVYTITGYTSGSFTVAMSVANTSGNCLVYPESCRVYLFNTAGARLSGTASISLKGY